jgi:hypothetical protein
VPDLRLELIDARLTVRDLRGGLAHFRAHAAANLILDLGRKHLTLDSGEHLEFGGLSSQRRRLAKTPLSTPEQMKRCRLS